MNNTITVSSSKNELKSSRGTPDEESIALTLASAKKEPLNKNMIIIARYRWLVRNKLAIPDQIELPNLYIAIKEGKLIRARYDNILPHIIKKQRYYIQILN